MEKIKLILADEDKNALNDLSKNFQSDKYIVLATTSSGEELIQLIKTKQPDAVIMDIVLQHCDGFKVLEEVANLNSKIIIQSSLSIDGFINKAISLGASYYCIKPFDVETLKERLDDLLNQNTAVKNTFYNNKISNHIEEKITNILKSRV